MSVADGVSGVSRRRAASLVVVRRFVSLLWVGVGGVIALVSLSNSAADARVLVASALIVGWVAGLLSLRSVSRRGSWFALFVVSAIVMPTGAAAALNVIGLLLAALLVVSGLVVSG